MDVRRWPLMLAALSLVVLTGTTQYRYGSWHQSDAPFALAGFSVPGGLGPSLLAAHAIKVLLLPLAVELWRRQYRVAALLASFVFLALATISVGSTLGAHSVQRHDRVVAEAAAFKREGDLRAELALLGDHLKNVGWRRSVAEIGADIAAEQRHPFTEATAGCTTTSNRSQRIYCARVDRLRGELEAAKESEEVRRRERDRREKLFNQAPTSEVRHPDLVYIAAALGLPTDQIAFGRMLLLALTIEAAEALPLWFLALLSSKDGGGHAQRARWDWWRTKTWLPLWQSPHPNADAAVTRKDSSKTGANAKPKAARRLGARKDRRSASCPLGCPRRTSAVPETDVRKKVKDGVAAFVAKLALDPAARETGSALFAAYDRLRAENGWPHIPANAFGAHLKPAIEAVGGQKKKSSVQFYLGVRLPPGH